MKTYLVGMSPHNEDFIFSLCKNEEDIKKVIKKRHKELFLENVFVTIDFKKMQAFAYETEEPEIYQTYWLVELHPIK